MRMFFSAVQSADVLQFCVDGGANSFLFSYESPSVCKRMLEALKAVETKCAIIIDSGAFSAWNRGAEIKLDDYIKFIELVKSANLIHDVFFINLDVIPHTKGQKKTPKADIEKACIKGIENYHYIKDRGHSTLHTFHMFEDFKYLDLIIKECNDLNYICISPANDASLPDRNDWLMDIFHHIRQKVRTHVLGLTAKESLERFPCYSADSSSWKNGPRWGHIFNFRELFLYGGTGDLDRENIGYKDFDGKFCDGFHYHLNLETYITKLWTKRGVIWN